MRRKLNAELNDPQAHFKYFSRRNVYNMDAFWPFIVLVLKKSDYSVSVLQLPDVVKMKHVLFDSFISCTNANGGRKTRKPQVTDFTLQSSSPYILGMQNNSLLLCSC